MEEVYHVIEEEPSHEIYANVVGLKVTNLSHTTYNSTLNATICNSSSECCSTHAPNSIHVQQQLETHAGLVSIDSLPADHMDTNSNNANGVLFPIFGEDLLNAKSPIDKSLSVYRKRLAESPASSSMSQISLDQTNKGFRILEKMGWKEIQGGLGSRRQGMIAPIKTTLKRDKRGIGSGKQTSPKVTHTMRRERKQNPLVTDRTFVDGARRSKKARMLITSELPEEYLAYL